MAQEIGIYNAIGWANVQLRGGWKNIAITSLGYGILLAMLMFATVQLNPMASGSIMYGWTIGLLGLQAGVLLIFGCITITSAVRSDHTSKMIESHRIMPTSAPMAILGYVFGSPCQAISMSLANFILGAIAASGAQVAFQRWAMANFVLFSFAVFLWVLVLFFGFLAQTAFRWIVSVFIVAFWMTQGSLLVLLPGLTVLVSPLFGNSIFSMRTTTATLSWEYMLSGAAQLLVGSICFAAAARKYRSAMEPALGYDLGHLFLAAWVALSWLGLHYWEVFDPHWLRIDLTGERVRFIATLLATMLVALIPVTGAARAEVKYNRRLRSGDIPRARRPVSPLIITALASVLPLILISEAPDRLADVPGALPRTATAIASFIFSMSFLMRLIEKEGRRVWMVPAAWVVLTWAVPVLADLMYHGLAENAQRATGILSTLSPAGAIFEIWNPSSFTRLDTTIGLGVQAGIAIALGIIFYARRLKRVGMGGMGSGTPMPVSDVSN